MPGFMGIIAIIVPILAIGIFGFTIAMMFSPKMRSKMLGKQIKSIKYTIDDNKEDIEHIMATSGTTVIKSKKNILDNNEDTLKEMSRQEAEINAEAIEIKTRAIKKGLFDNEKNAYCKYCGALIDEDSIYCKECGKKQK